jgi:4-amino-4-deoxy-L-arabinose transferase-like glycosyltransferase
MAAPASATAPDAAPHPARGRLGRFREAGHSPFAIVLAGGLLVRLVVMALNPSGSLYWLDSVQYLKSDVFATPQAPAGYLLFTHGLHAIWASITLIALLQHLLGLIGAALVYWAARDSGLGPWLGAAATVPMLFAGEVIALEHGPMTETLMTVLLNAGLVMLLHAVHRSSWAWAAGAGAALGLAVTVRTVVLPIAAVAALWALLAAGGGVGRRLRVAVPAVVGVALVLGGYLALASTGRYAGVGDVGGAYLYARVAPIADCTKFNPPPGTRGLCETSPPAGRAGTLYYQIGEGNPRYRVFPRSRTDYTAGNAKLGAWARRVILAQPLDYLKLVLGDLPRYFEKDAEVRPQSGNGFLAVTLGNENIDAQVLVVNALRGTYDVSGPSKPHAAWLLKLYSGVTRIDGLVLAALLLLALAGAVLRSPARHAAVLGLLVTLVLMVFPVLTLIWSQRYVIPAYGMLGLAAAVGANALAARFSARRASAAAAR